MTTYIALFRGINVGGKNVLPMQPLTAIFETLGASNVKTYIQSGNVVFQSGLEEISDLSNQIKTDVRDRYGFEPYIMMLSLSDLETAIQNNPFPAAESQPSSLHLGFLACVPENPNLEKLESLKTDSERFCLVDQVFYLHLPDGMGRSKLAASSEKLLGAPMTARNWTTVLKLKDLAAQ
jgi:uncharacterized protein (DUF1697 family)